MKNKISTVIIILCVLSGCENQCRNKKIPLLFIDASVNSSDVLRCGLKKVKGVDIPTYYYEDFDTTVVYTLNFDESFVTDKKWMIHVPNINFERVKNFFAKRNCYIQGKVNKFSLESGEFFFISSSNTNVIYKCRIDQEADNLVIYYSFPYRNNSE